VELFGEIMIKNKQSDLILAQNQILCETFWSQVWGAMFTPKSHFIPLLFDFKKTFKINIHMFCVFFPLDILWLDEQKKVVYIKKHAKPFTFVSCPVQAKYVVEVPAGTISNTQTKKGDVLEF
jgi:uncharacterized protein